MKPRLSRVTKMDGILSWSLPAMETCPGATGPDGNVVDVCQHCYAMQGRYHLPTVKEPREFNRHDWKRSEWVNDMVCLLRDSRYFRWFDSGDIHHPMLARKILELVQRTPWCNHWIPTRSYKIERIRPHLEAINAEPNAVVRYSGDNIDGSYDAQVLAPNAAIVVPSAEEAPEGVHVCPARENTPACCNGCRACWDPEVAVVAYPLHGRRVFKLQEVS